MPGSDPIPHKMHAHMMGCRVGPWGTQGDTDLVYLLPPAPGQKACGSHKPASPIIQVCSFPIS